MPGLDRQGPPFGNGNQSGRRMGKCNPDNKMQNNKQTSNEWETERGLGRRWRHRNSDETTENSDSNPIRMGRGRGRNQGMGRGFRFSGGNNPSNNQQD